MFFDPLYLILMVPGLFISLWASWKTKSAFKKYSRVRSGRGLTGVQSRDFAPGRIDAPPVTYLEGWALKEPARGLPMQPGLVKHASPGGPPSLLKSLE